MGRIENPLYLPKIVAIFHGKELEDIGNDAEVMYVHKDEYGTVMVDIVPGHPLTEGEEERLSYAKLVYGSLHVNKYQLENVTSATVISKHTPRREEIEVLFEVAPTTHINPGGSMYEAHPPVNPDTFKN